MTRVSSISSLASRLRDRHPELAQSLDDVLHLCAQIDHALPRARAVTDPGDGLRSPNLSGGGRSIGGHSDPTLAAAVAHGVATGDPLFLGSEDDDEPATPLRRKTAPGGTALHAADRRLREAEDALREALSIPTHTEAGDRGTEGQPDASAAESEAATNATSERI